MTDNTDQHQHADDTDTETPTETFHLTIGSHVWAVVKADRGCEMEVNRHGMWTFMDPTDENASCYKNWRVRVRPFVAELGTDVWAFAMVRNGKRVRHKCWKPGHYTDCASDITEYLINGWEVVE